jgi:hypothetical protein
MEDGAYMLALVRLDPFDDNAEMWRLDDEAAVRRAVTTIKRRKIAEDPKGWTDRSIAARAEKGQLVVQSDNGIGAGVAHVGLLAPPDEPAPAPPEGVTPSVAPARVAERIEADCISHNIQVPWQQGRQKRPPAKLTPRGWQNLSPTRGKVRDRESVLQEIREVYPSATEQPHASGIFAYWVDVEGKPQLVGVAWPDGWWWYVMLPELTFELGISFSVIDDGNRARILATAQVEMILAAEKAAAVDPRLSPG